MRSLPPIITASHNGFYITLEFNLRKEDYVLWNSGLSALYPASYVCGFNTWCISVP